MVTIDIAGKNDGCELTVTHEGLRTAEERDNHIEGWRSCLERLTARLDGLDG
jgi:hypothetical protein